MSDATIRLAITLGLLGLFIVLESCAPARRGSLSFRRLITHITMAGISAVLARLALAGGLASVAGLAAQWQVGLFNVVLVPNWIAILATFLILDFAIWSQHLALHKVPLLWRLHRVHHSDTNMDVSTALRFHPIEILVSLAFKAAIVILLGAPPAAVFAFEIVLGAGALFTHANIAIPKGLERIVRVILVTPALHLIHHSPIPVETNSNFGFSFTIWDRLFGTYREVRLAPERLIGLEHWRAGNDQKLGALLANPLLKVAAD